MEIVKILSAILAPLVAVFGLYIGWRQHRINKEKLKLDLFDRRFKVYDATKRYLSQISAEGSVSNDELVDFLIATSESYFLFGQDIEKYLNELYLKGVDLNYTQKQMRSGKLSKEAHSKVVDKDHEAFTWLTEQLTESKAVFGKYMRFDK